MSLKRLVARSVRGIPRSWPELEIGDKGLVTYGGNGVGKSSIVDALEFALSSRSSLYPVSRQQVNWDTGAPHVRDGAPDISVEIAVGGHTASVAPQQDLSELRADQGEWITAAQNATYVLRRHMLLRFIVEEPRSRYVLLEPFMNLTAYKAVEDALRDWLDGIDTRRAALSAQITEAEENLRAIFDLPPGQLSEAALLPKLNIVLAQLGIPACVHADELEARHGEIGRQIGGRESTERLAAAEQDLFFVASRPSRIVSPMLSRNCRYLIHHDLSWNPSTLEQRTGRVDRIGAKAEAVSMPIEVFMPYIGGTQDEKQYRVVMDRERWFQVLMGEEYRTDESYTEVASERVPLPVAAAEALAFDLSVKSDLPNIAANLPAA